MGDRWSPSKGKNKRTVWRICPKGFKESHFAVFPEELCETPIKAGCPEGGIVLDPFFGAGTTGLVALKQNKQFVGIELNKDYIKIAEARIKPYLEQEKLE
jgi:DNA modification methylase